MKLRTFLLALILATASIGFISLNAQAEDGDSQTIYGAIIYNVAFHSYSPASGDSDLDAVENDLGINKIGVKGKKGNTSYTFEFGFNDKTDFVLGDTTNNNVYLRVGKVAVDVGGINIMVGQDYNPYTQLGSCLVAQPVFAKDQIATAYDGRTPQVKISMMGVYLALIQPAGTDSLAHVFANEQLLTWSDTDHSDVNNIDGIDANALAYKNGIYDVSLPKIAIGYAGKVAGIDLGAGFAYSTIKVENATDSLGLSGNGAGSTDYEGESVDAWNVNVKASGQMGAIGFKFSFNYVNNPFEFGFAPGINDLGTVLSTLNLAKGANGVATTRTVKDGKAVDTTGMGGFLEVSYNFGMGAVQAGLAYQQTSNDEWSDDDTSMTYYIQVPIGLAPNFKVAPGFMVQDAMKDNTGGDEDKNTYFGLAFIGSF